MGLYLAAYIGKTVESGKGIAMCFVAVLVKIMA